MASARRQRLRGAEDEDEYDYRRQVSTAGNSTAILLPAEFVTQQQIEVGEEVGIDTDGRTMTVEFPIRESQSDE